MHMCGQADGVRQAAARMVTLAIKRLPVVDGDGRLAGIISQRDIRWRIGEISGVIDLRDQLSARGPGPALRAASAPT
jgi:CBS-domain-containing membrane protein